MRVTSYFTIAAKWLGPKSKMDHPTPMNDVFASRGFGLVLAKLELIWEEDHRGKRIPVRGRR